MKCNESLWTFPTKTTEKINLLDVHLVNLIFALFFYCEELCDPFINTCYMNGVLLIFKFFLVFNALCGSLFVLG